MAKELQMQQTMKVWTKLATTMLDPTFKFSGGGATTRTLEKFLGMMEAEFGSITAERLVDFCICTAYAYRDRTQWTIKQIFGKASIQRLVSRKRGSVWHEDNWLQEQSLEREALIRMIADRSEHPQAKYIYVASEEPTKRRLLNKEVGYIVCQTSTLGWSPISEACQECEFVERCKGETKTKFPELYRIRVDYGKAK